MPEVATPQGQSEGGTGNAGASQISNNQNGNGQGFQQTGSNGPINSGNGANGANGVGLANGFLANIPEQDRAIVEKYVRDWDAGVTRQFQELHSRYQPYEQLGADPETIQQAIAVMQQIETNPHEVLQLLQEALEQEGGNREQGQLGNGNGQQQQEESWAPPEFLQEFDRLKTGLETIAQMLLEERQNQQAAQEDQELDNMLSQAKQQFGDFDEDYVLTKMQAGMSIEQAVQSFNQLLQGAKNNLGQQRTLPPVLNGSGVATTENSKTVKDLSRKETTELVAHILAQANQES